MGMTMAALIQLAKAAKLTDADLGFRIHGSMFMVSDIGLISELCFLMHLGSFALVFDGIDASM